jgi:type III secretion protein Q
MSDTVFPVPGICRNPGDVPARSLLQGAPRLHADDALLSRKLGLGLHSPLEQGASLTLRPGGVSNGYAGGQSVPLWLSGPAGPLEVDDGARLLRVLTGIDLESVEMEAGRYPDWLVAAVLGRLQGTPLRATQDIAPASAFTTPPHAMRLRVSHEHHVFDLPLRAAGATWLELLSQPDWTPLRSPLTASLDWPATATVVLARHRLPLAALSRIEAGDIILPAQAAFAIDGGGMLRLAGQAWRVCYRAPGSLQLIAKEERLEFEQTYEAGDGDDQQVLDPAPGDGPEDGQEVAPQEGADEAVLDQVSVTLVFELGRVSLPLGQVRTLGPQTVLTLDGGNPAAIGIVCGGRSVGSGEVVDVDGVLGIRITQWGGAC